MTNYTLMYCYHHHLDSEMRKRERGEGERERERETVSIIIVSYRISYKNQVPLRDVLQLSASLNPDLTTVAMI